MFTDPLKALVMNNRNIVRNAHRELAREQEEREMKSVKASAVAQVNYEEPQELVKKEIGYVASAAQLPLLPAETYIKQLRGTNLPEPDIRRGEYFAQVQAQKKADEEASKAIHGTRAVRFNEDIDSYVLGLKKVQDVIGASMDENEQGIKRLETHLLGCAKERECIVKALRSTDLDLNERAKQIIELEKCDAMINRIRDLQHYYAAANSKMRLQKFDCGVEMLQAGAARLLSVD